MRARGLIGLLALVGLLTAAAPALAQLHGNPMATGPWFLDDHWKPAAREMRYQDHIGHHRTARQLKVLADHASGKWWPWAFGEKDTRAYVERVAAEASPRTLSFFVTENAPKPNCVHNRIVGSPNPSQFRAWAAAFARGIGRRRAIVVVESDGIGESSCLRGRPLADRIALIRYEVMKLAALPNVGLYIDAGASDWLKPGRAAQLLRMAGIAHVRGFSLGVTHYEWTRDEMAYGKRVSALLGGKHFIVNTSFNGRGPLPGPHGHVWCNPVGRALGSLPTLHTRSRLADAFFWAAPPGLSDGPCGQVRGSRRGPPVGTWWLTWALELVRNSTHAPDFPRYR